MRCINKLYKYNFSTEIQKGLIAVHIHFWEFTQHFTYEMMR